MKNAARLFAALILAAGLAACQTIQGAGRDIQNAGEAIEDAVDSEE